MSKDQTEIGIAGLPIPKKKWKSGKKRHEFEKKRRENLGPNVAGTPLGQDVNPNFNPNTVRQTTGKTYVSGGSSNPYYNPRTKMEESQKKTYKEFIEEALAYRGGEPLPPLDKAALERIRARLKDMGKGGSIQNQQAPVEKRKPTVDLKKVDIREARAEDKRGLPPTGKNRTKQKLHRKGSTAYSGGQNPHLRGKNSTKAQRRERNRSRYLDHPNGPYDTTEKKDKYLDMQKEKRTSPYNSRFD